MVVELILRWVHILSAITLMGGALFMRFTLLPAVASLDEATQTQLHNAVRQRWARIVATCSGLLLISGLVNAVSVIKQYELDPVYHMLVMVKLLLALAVFFLSAVLSGRSGLAERMRQQRTRWLNITLLLALILVCVAGYMKMMDRTPKPEAASARQVFQPLTVGAVRGVHGIWPDSVVSR